MCFNGQPSPKHNIYLAILGSPNYKVLITGAALDEEYVCVEQGIQNCQREKDIWMLHVK